MTLDDLVKLYESHGIKASVPDLRNVVMALREGIRDIEPEVECCGNGVPNHDNTAEECCCSPDCWLHAGAIDNFFNEILGDAVEAAAPKDEDHLGVAVGKEFGAPAAEPSVCVWTRKWPDFNTWKVECREAGAMFGATYSAVPPSGATYCCWCSLPIKFKEPSK